MTLLRISPDGSEVMHLYNDKIKRITSKTSDIKVYRASEVYYCNKDVGWKIKLLHSGLVLPIMFSERQDAIDYEIEFLEQFLKEGKRWSETKRRSSTRKKEE
jgi:hypothetical protein